MRRANLLTVALALVVAALAPGRAAAAPALVFERETCDLGSIVQGEQPACDFLFSNAGTDALRLVEVEPSCGCTTVLLSAPLAPPGANGAIRVVFDSGNYAGDVVKDIEVRSNDPARPVVILRVQALVEPEIDFEPSQATFDNVRPGAQLRQQVMLTNRSAAPVRLLRLQSQPSSCRCLLPAWTDPTRPLVLESWDRLVIEVLFASPGSLAMPIAGECAFEIEGPRKRHFSLKVLALPAP